MVITHAAEFTSDFVQMGTVYMRDIKIGSKSPFLFKKKKKFRIKCFEFVCGKKSKAIEAI